MSKHLSELCALLTDDLYGQLPSRILSLLLNTGRLTLFLLVQRSRLPPRRVKAGLAILIQQNLVLYHAPEEETVTYYSANIRNAYDLIRVGKNTRTVSRALGEPPPDLVENLFLGGAVRASEATQWQYVSHERSSTTANGSCNDNAHINGIDHAPHQGHEDHNEVDSGPERRRAMQTMFDQRYAIRVRRIDYLPDYDFDEMMELDVFRRLGLPKGKEAKIDFENEISKTKARTHYDTKYRFQPDESGSSVLKRSPNDSSASTGADDADARKRRKTDNGPEPPGIRDGMHTTDQHGDDGEIDTEDVAIRVNQEKIDVARRNECLMALAAKSLDSSVVAQVYGTLLSCSTRKIKSCYDQFADEEDDAIGDSDTDDDDDDDDGAEANAADERAAEGRKLERSGNKDASFAVSSMEVEKELDPKLDLAAFMKSPEDKKKSNKRKMEDEDDQDRPAKKSKTSKTTSLHTNHQSDADNEGGAIVEAEPVDEHAVRTDRIGQVDMVLGMLAEHQHRFVHRTTADRDKRYRVNLRGLSRKMIQIELEGLITARFGTLATLIVRQLCAHGKLDEKAIASACILPVKDVRAALSALQAASLVETQEVPRDNMRMPSKTIYLWYFDQDRCRKLVLNDVYKAMCRLLQRRRVEKEKVQSVVDKAERSDVRGHEDEYLNEHERRRLTTWEACEEKILVEVARLDTLVAVLRDFLPPKMM